METFYISTIIFLGFIAVCGVTHSIQVDRENDRLRREAATDFYNRSVADIRRRERTRRLTQFINTKKCDITVTNQLCRQYLDEGYDIDKDLCRSGLIAFSKDIEKDEED